MSQDKCPVDHTQRTNWLKALLWKSPDCPNKIQLPQETHIESDQPKCPVDPSARSSWLGHMPKEPPARAQAVEAIEVDKSCDSEKIKSDPIFSLNTALPTDREISLIPRTDADSNWIYPSQKQFFEAMMRKNWSPEAADMQTVVPIHNQVNELAWSHILNWERSHLEEMEKKCGGISLTSFKGDLKKLTPRAWVRLAIFGQDKPFDRHDWLINRCGVEVPYVIDFYGTDRGVVVDARPKVDSWEGLKLRVGRAIGIY